MSDYRPAYNPNVGDIASITLTSTTGKTLELKTDEMDYNRLHRLYDALDDLAWRVKGSNGMSHGELLDALLHQLQTRAARENAARWDGIVPSTPRF